MNVKNVKDDEVDTFWKNQLAEISNMSVEDLRTHNLPISRIKKIMKEDDEIKSNQMVSADTPVLLAKACELFIMELTNYAWKFTEESKRRTLQRQDVISAACKRDIFDFLIDLIPIEERIKFINLNVKGNSKRNNNGSSSSGNGSGDGSQGGGNHGGGNLGSGNHGSDNYGNGNYGNDNYGNDNHGGDNHGNDNHRVDFDTVKQYYNLYSSACNDKGSVSMQALNAELAEMAELAEKELNAANAVTAANLATENGMGANGMGANGMGANRIAANGIAANGITANGTIANMANLRDVAQEFEANLNALYKSNDPDNASTPPPNHAANIANNLFLSFNQNSHLTEEHSSSNSNHGGCMHNTKGSDETHRNSLNSSGNQYTQVSGITKYNSRGSCSSNNQGSTSEHFGNNSINANHVNFKYYSSLNDNMARQSKQEYINNILNESSNLYHEMHQNIPISRTVNIPSTLQNKDLNSGNIPSYQKLQELKNKFGYSMQTGNIPNVSNVSNISNVSNLSILSNVSNLSNLSNVSNVSNDNGYIGDNEYMGNIHLNPNLHLTSLSSSYNAMPSTHHAMAQYNMVNNDDMRKPKVGAHKQVLQVQNTRDVNTRDVNMWDVQPQDAHPNGVSANYQRHQSGKSDDKSSDDMNPQQSYVYNYHHPGCNKMGLNVVSSHILNGNLMNNMQNVCLNDSIVPRNNTPLNPEPSCSSSLEHRNAQNGELPKMMATQMITNSQINTFDKNRNSKKNNRSKQGNILLNDCNSLPANRTNDMMSLNSIPTKSNIEINKDMINNYFKLNNNGITATSTTTSTAATTAATNISAIQNRKGHGNHSAHKGNSSLVGDNRISDGLLHEGLLTEGLLSDGLLSEGLLSEGMLNDGALNDGTLNDGMLNDGMLNDGMLNDGLLNDGMLNEELLNEGVRNEDLMSEDLLNEDMINDGHINSGRLKNSMLNSAHRMADQFSGQLNIQPNSNMSAPMNKQINARMAENGLNEILNNSENTVAKNTAINMINQNIDNSVSHNHLSNIVPNMKPTAQQNVKLNVHSKMYVNPNAQGVSSYQPTHQYSAQEKNYACNYNPQQYHSNKVKEKTHSFL
ncbi:histone [Plasmodium cynomolgi strain B]|uniref:Histone n=1 Tax=Plasmodium cynomolgi (strain B) TaxID=1120755 RepID=K6UEE1_PLACD|nr:histone [Plasmodium cynomolgi strain B]GAB68191.1 histone [Plasmodium cynomolgi strain B]